MIVKKLKITELQKVYAKKGLSLVLIRGEKFDGKQCYKVEPLIKYYPNGFQYPLGGQMTLVGARAYFGSIGHYLDDIK
jgi:hypothetical protein